KATRARNLGAVAIPAVSPANPVGARDNPVRDGRNTGVDRGKSEGDPCNPAVDASSTGVDRRIPRHDRDDTGRHAHLFAGTRRPRFGTRPTPTPRPTRAPRAPRLLVTQSPLIRRSGVPSLPFPDR